MPPNQQNVPENAQSFKLYSGKAPLLVQIVAGLMWLGSAGMILSGLLSLLLSPLTGVLLFGVAGYTIYTAKRLFSMKKNAFMHSIIWAVLVVASVLCGTVMSAGSISYTNFISPLLLILLAFVYRSRFVN